ncbi:integrase catalytic subunit [Perkinsela sp. CCAP 1560/4]|nr:integrase catalytic subunit [Perkinsela sp. CCAP 1560/4]|eukprot:KNH08630.1 integrase catalytic subunit [Perkinsela sp. CCAP 1560/4]
MFTHITLADRKHIESYLNLGETPKSFAQKLGRSASSIRAEIKRNTLPGKKYSAEIAHNLAVSRSQNAFLDRLAITQTIADRIRKILETRVATPGEISREMCKSSSGRIRVTPSSIRRYVHHHPDLLEKLPPRGRESVRETTERSLGKSQENMQSPKFVDGDIVTY